MIDEFKIKGLEKLVNSSAIKGIYPMVDHISIFPIKDSEPYEKWDRLSVDIFLKDKNITAQNMYEMDFDPHYLVDYHIKQYLPYLNISTNVIIDFIVWSPDGSIITSFKY